MKTTAAVLRSADQPYSIETIDLPEIEAGGIDLFPEYTGPVLTAWDPETTARTADDVYSALLEVVKAKRHR